MNAWSLSEFVSMRGYGLYVWGSYLVCLVVMVIEPLLVAQRHRRALEAARELPDEES